ncbi:MAG: hypothetical protein WCE49_12260, partial [Terrimicrobiaceae bacterium]
MSQLESLASCLRDQSSHGCVGHNQVCFCNVNSRLPYRHLYAKGLRIELDEHVAFAHSVVVVHEHSHYLAGNARRNKGDIAINISIIGRDSIQTTQNSRYSDDKHHECDQPSNQKLEAWTLGPGRSGRFR